MMRICSYLDQGSKRAIYNSFIVSNFNYCSTVWMFTNRGNLNKLEKLNKRALPMIYNNYTSDYDVLLRNSLTLNVYMKCLKSLGIEMYKVRSNLTPVYMKELFLESNPVYDLRDSSRFVLPKYKTKTFGYRSLSYIGSKLWNDIDFVIKDSS